MANFLSEKFIQTTCSKNKVSFTLDAFLDAFSLQPEVKEMTSVQIQLDIHVNLQNYDYDYESLSYLSIYLP